jgi:thiamine transport system ATP-binding protein
MLHIESLSAAYEEVDVLRDVHLEVPAGQLLCVLGPSGSGKSTLLRVIAGLEEPRLGRVQLEGRDLAGVPPHLRDVGLMFQDYALFPHRNVAENIAFGLRMRGEGRAAVRARTAELLRLVGLPGAERRPVAQLSGGEQQRVALARALAPRPRLLMLDEPMGSLDRSLRERLPEELRGIFAELGLTVIYVTHDQGEALSVADRVVLLHEGRVVADGSPEELWTRPPTAWAARFLGFRNVAPARLTADGLETPWGRLPIDAVDGAHAAPGAVTVVLRSAGLITSADGPIHGRVLARRFGGDHVLLVIEVADAPPLYVEAREGLLPTVGELVALSPRPGAIGVIDEHPAEATGAGGTEARLP